MQAGAPDEMDHAGNRQKNEYRQREEVKQRIPTRVVGKSLWFLLGHGEVPLARTCKCNRGTVHRLTAAYLRLRTGLRRESILERKNPTCHVSDSSVTRL